MHTIEAILLGILQGLTEFLPVSSSGHLVLARTLMKMNDIPILFDVILHLATLLVVIWVFRRRILTIIAVLWRFIHRRNMEEDAPILRLIINLCIASALTAMVGLAVITMHIRENPTLVASLFLCTAVLLLITQKACGNVSLEDISRPRALFIGLIQGLGVLPGLSRSGLTMASGLLLGLDRKAAAEFSFILSIPTILGAFLISLKDIEKLSTAVSIGALTAGFMAAFIVGYIALKFLLWLMAEGQLWVFSIYLFPTGIIALIHFAF